MMMPIIKPEFFLNI